MRHDLKSFGLLAAALLFSTCSGDPGGTGDPDRSSTGTGGCEIFPADNPWNQDITGLPVHPDSAAYLANIRSQGADALHADFGTVYNGLAIGIPYQVIEADQALVPILFEYEGESDTYPDVGEFRYPIPEDPPREDGEGDRHILLIQKETCLLFEIFRAERDGSEADCGSGGWCGGSGAIFDLSSNDLRPAGWTSADAAGLPIFPGLVRYDEVMTGEVSHALRFTVPSTQAGYISPARHEAGDCAECPPMGLRLRLKADADLSNCIDEYQPIARALQKHGMFLADNGGNLFVSGVPDSRWDDGALADCLGSFGTNDFDVVDTGPIETGP